MNPWFSPTVDPTDWRAGCGRSACPVRRGEGPGINRPFLPLSGVNQDQVDFYDALFCQWQRRDPLWRASRKPMASAARGLTFQNVHVLQEVAAFNPKLGTPLEEAGKIRHMHFCWGIHGRSFNDHAPRCYSAFVLSGPKQESSACGKSA